jgi:hypothetical protein
MEQSPSGEANSHLASQEITGILWNCLQEPTTGPHPEQDYPVHNFQSYFPYDHFNVSFPFTPTASEWSLLSRFFNQSFMSLHALYMPRPSHPP